VETLETFEEIYENGTMKSATNITKI